MSNLFGSICLSDIPRELMKKVMCKDGVERIYLNVSVGELKEPAVFGGNTFTHYISCAPKKEERIEGRKYYLGNLQTFNRQPSAPTAEQINNAPPVSPTDDLPF